MTLVTGDLQTITDTPSSVRKVRVRAHRTHPSGGGDPDTLVQAVTTGPDGQ